MKRRKSFKCGLTSCFQAVRRPMGWVTLCLGVCMLGLAVSANAQNPTIITFDPPGAGTGAGQGTNTYGVTPQGEIIGWYVDGSYAIHGFLRTPQGVFTTIDASGEGIDATNGTLAVAMNARGVIGGAYLDEYFVFHGFLRAPDGTFTKLDDDYAGINPGTGTRVADINAAGTITGWSDDSNNVNHIFLRDVQGNITEFYAPGAGTGDGQGTFMPTLYGLSPAGAITGWYVDPDSVMHGFLRAPDGTFTSFDVTGAGTDSSACEGIEVAPPIVGTQALSLNPEGVILGQYGDENCIFHGFLRGADGSITQFDPLDTASGAGQGTYVVSNNPAGEATGYYTDNDDVSHGFVRAPDGTLTTFDVPGAGTGAGQGTFPLGNNPAGVIAGYYVDSDGALHGFLRVP